jgi:uncharacterized protein
VLLDTSRDYLPALTGFSLVPPRQPKVSSAMGMRLLGGRTVVPPWYDLPRMSLEFEWDPRKADNNRATHGIRLEEALTVFRDPLARIFEDEEHSQTEPREIVIGHPVKQRLILVCFTVQETRIRIISARRATRLERQDYEENFRP